MLVSVCVVPRAEQQVASSVQCRAESMRRISGVYCTQSENNEEEEAVDEEDEEDEEEMVTSSRAMSSWQMEY